MSGDHGQPEHALRAEAIESLLEEKGLVDAATIDAVIEAYEHDIGPMNGAAVVAKAWKDPDYKRRLLSDGDLRQRFSRAATSRVREQYDVPRAAAEINRTLQTVGMAYRRR